MEQRLKGRFHTDPVQWLLRGAWHIELWRKFLWRQRGRLLPAGLWSTAHPIVRPQCIHAQWRSAQRCVPAHWERILQYEMSIYNRWGEKIFFSDSLELGWDGLYKGQPQPTGIYNYALRYLISRERYRTQKGTLYLSR